MPRSKPSDAIISRMTFDDHEEIRRAEESREWARLHLKRVRDRIRTRIMLAIAKEQAS